MWDPKPHHGKLHSLSPAVWRQRYVGYKKVLEASKLFDPKSRLENDVTRLYLKGRQKRNDGEEEEDVPTMRDPAFQKMADEFRELADQMSEMDIMDQILIDQVDEVLSEDEEDLALLSALGDQIGSMESSELYYDGL